MNSSFVVYCLIFCSCLTTNAAAPKLDHKRLRRYLIYPRGAPTRFQYVTGIGIPADLTYESCVIGYVLKAEYFLPFNESVYRRNPFFGEYPAETYLDERKISDEPAGEALRWAVYKFIEKRLESYGYNGQECMLKAICEANALHFDRQYNIFGELMHILFSPTTSNDLDSDLTSDYFEAERTGYKGEEACEIYNCKLSLLNLISTILDI